MDNNVQNPLFGEPQHHSQNQEEDTTVDKNLGIPESEGGLDGMQNDKLLSPAADEQDNFSADAEPQSVEQDIVAEPARVPFWRKKEKKSRRKVQIGIASILCIGLLSGVVGGGITALSMSGLSANPGETVSIANGTSLVSVVNTSIMSGEALTIAEISAKVSPSVVSITTTVQTSNRFGRSETSSGSGSGIIFAENGYILTNNHVIDGAESISVRLFTGTEYTATIIGSDSQTDLAVLKIEADNLPFVTMGDSDNLQVGDLAVAIGNPLGELSGTVTTGIISATDREITIDNETMNLLQTDAAVNPGNSGGALCNAYGEVIGVVNAKTSALGVEGLGFAIPINDAKPVIEELLQNGYVSGRATMNVSVQEVTAQTAAFFRMEAGVYVAEATSGGAADRAGIKAGDRIVSADDKEIETAADLKSVIESHSVGDLLNVVISRNSSEASLTLTLNEET